MKQFRYCIERKSPFSFNNCYCCNRNALQIIIKSNILLGDLLISIVDVHPVQLCARIVSLAQPIFLAVSSTSFIKNLIHRIYPPLYYVARSGSKYSFLLWYKCSDKHIRGLASPVTSRRIIGTRIRPTTPLYRSNGWIVSNW